MIGYSVRVDAARHPREHDVAARRKERRKPRLPPKELVDDA
jgi:hypothetical protein